MRKLETSDQSHGAYKWQTENSDSFLTRPKIWMYNSVIWYDEMVTGKFQQFFAPAGPNVWLEVKR